MTSSDPTCFIWNTPVSTSAPAWANARPRWIDDSPRAGGGYETDGFVGTDLHGLDDQKKALLTTWLIDERTQGNPYPRITLFGSHQVLEKLNPLQIGDRAHRLLTLLAGRSGTIGQQVSIALPDDESVNPSRYGAIDDVPEPVCNLWRAMAWSESTTIGEVIFLVDYLVENGWMKRNGLKQPDSVSVTVEGYAHIAESRANVDRAQAFVAMWFNEEMVDGYEQGIRLAITDTGYTPMRIDRKEHINKIDDEIVAEIRRSRFLVADFSQGGDGARGGVYFEAGFAYGLEIPAIYTCRKSDIEKLHFDTRQYNHIVWESPEDLREALRNRILAVIGEGPNAANAGQAG